MGIDRHGEDDSGPGAGDSLRSAPADLPDIPNDPAAPPAARDSTGSQTPAERFAEYKAKVEAAYRQEGATRCWAIKARAITGSHTGRCRLAQERHGRAGGA